jgi:biotin-(acetyl-CoA carboxylase) ligase
LIGKEVTVIEASKTYRAKVIDIDQNANLVVEKDGIRSVLSSGEIHIRDYY